MTLNRSNKSTLYFGGILIGIGLLFLLRNTGIINFDFLFENFWPLLLIGVGAFVVYKNYHRKDVEQGSMTFGDRSEYSADDSINASHTFGDFKVSLASQKFKGGKIQTTFGDLHLDLAKIRLAEGKNLLHANVTFGEIVVNLPKDLPVRISASNVGGDIKLFEQKWDGLNQRAFWQSDLYESAAAKLDIVCSIFFGDIKVW